MESAWLNQQLGKEPMEANRRPSIHDAPPTEFGGVSARQGFAYQDHVAAGFCLEMLLDEKIEQVWCEVFDDVTLFLGIDGVQEVEFVQVKSNELNQLW